MNSNVIQLISMLLCIAVVVCFFIFNYNRGVDVQDSKAKVQKLHLFYISGILVFIIIELATGLCMGNAKHDDILSYVNFAATLSSLIMSVVAIIEVESYFGGLKELLEESIQMTIDSITNESAKQSQIQRWEDIKKVFE